MDIMEIVLTRPDGSEKIVCLADSDSIGDAMVELANEYNMQKRVNWGYYKNEDGTTLVVRDLY